jgi:hypothetical protein
MQFGVVDLSKPLCRTVATWRTGIAEHLKHRSGRKTTRGKDRLLMSRAV